MALMIIMVSSIIIELVGSDGGVVTPPTGSLDDANTDTNTVIEGSASGTEVGITAEAGEGATYSLTDDANGRFAMTQHLVL